MPRIRPAKFVHVVYRTRRFDEMIRWYCTVFDAHVQHQSPVLAFMTYDEEHHRVALLNLSIVDPAGSPESKQGAVGVDHVAYTFNNLSDLVENYAFLKSQGIRPYWCLHHGITVSMYYADPDGNQMEFQVDSYPTVEAANAFMKGPGFDTNPIGVEYNPDELLKKVRSGADTSALLLRTEHLPVSPVRSWRDTPAA